MADSFKQFMANAFGGQTAPAMTEEELKQTQAGINPVTTMQPFQPTGGAGFVPASQVPIPGDTPVGASFMGDVGTAFQPLADIAQAQRGPAAQAAPQPSAPVAAPVGAPVTAPVGFGTVSQTPQVPSMQSVGLNPLTTEPQFGGVAATPSLQPELAQPTFQPQAPAMGEEATRAALGGMFNEAPQTLSQVTAQDPASIAAQQASESFGMESAAREARLPEVGEFRERAVPDASNMRGERQYTDSQIRDLAGGDAEVMGRMKAMDEQGIDPATGKSRAEAGLTFDQQMNLAKFQYQQEQDSIARAETAEERQQALDEQFQADTEKYQMISSDASRIGNLVNEAVGLTTEIGTTGLAGSILKHMPGSNANQLRDVLGVVQSKVALDRLAQVKATGATLGQVSNVELKMLQDSFDALGQNLKGERLREALVNYATNLQNIESKIAGAYQSKYKDRLGGESSGGSSSAPSVSYEGTNYEIVQ